MGALNCKGHRCSPALDLDLQFLRAHRKRGGRSDRVIKAGPETRIRRLVPDTGFFAGPRQSEGLCSRPSEPPIASGTWPALFSYTTHTIFLVVVQTLAAAGRTQRIPPAANELKQIRGRRDGIRYVPLSCSPDSGLAQTLASRFNKRRHQFGPQPTDRPTCGREGETAALCPGPTAEEKSNLQAARVSRHEHSELGKAGPVC